MNCVKGIALLSYHWSYIDLISSWCDKITCLLMDSAYVASCRKFHTCLHPLKAQQFTTTIHELVDHHSKEEKNIAQWSKMF